MSKKQDQNEQLQAFQKYYDGLNDEQKQAVDTIEGPVMTIAGAGTGKTQILAVRIAKILLETQIDPYNILCLTFTEAGVTAMRQRLIEIIGPPAYHVKISTFHRFCNEIIKDNCDVFLFRQEAEQLDDLERVEILQKIIDLLGTTSPIRPVGDPYCYLEDLSGLIQAIKKENIDPATLHLRLGELKILLKALKPCVEDFLRAKRTFGPELVENCRPAVIFPKLKLGEPTSFQKSYLDYLEHLFQVHDSALTGQKRSDNTVRKNLRDALQKLVDGLEQLPKQKELARAYELYQQTLTETGRYDYEDMIMIVSRELKNNEALLRRYQELYQYILVDEYQDTNSSQNQTVNLLGNFFEAPNIFVVGDDDQSIYRFQGASIENIIDFHKQFAPEIQLVTLIRNYRSQQTILDAAGALISNNQTRIANYLPHISKKLESQTGTQPAPLRVLPYATEQTEIFGTAKQIEKLIADGVDPAQIAILYRKHAEAEELTELMLKMNIPFQLKAGHDILEDLQITKLITLFRAIEKPNDDETVSQALFLDFLGFNKLDVLKFANFFYQKDLRRREQHSFLTALSNQDLLNQAKLSDTQKFLAFTQQIINWRELSENVTLPELFIRVLDECGFLKFLLNQHQRLEILNRLNSLYKEIKSQVRKNHQLTITQFLEQLKIRRHHHLKLIEEPLHTSRQAVQLMTCHGAKGLEFEYVFMIKCTDRSWNKPARATKIKLPKGLIKSIIADERLENEEDNRRLFYVAMTRAKKTLSISFARQRFEGGKGKEDIETRYLQEIPAEYQEQIDTSEYENNLPEYLQIIFQPQPESDLTKVETEHFKHLVENLVISPTALNTYLTCPRKFFYNNLIRLPQAKSASQGMGTAVHKALELFLNQYRQRKINPGKEFLLLHYQKELQRELLSEKDYKERVEYGRAIISDYFDEHSELLASNIYSEINFARHEVMIEGVRITGKIDKIAPDPDQENGLIVSDFKTGNADNGAKESKVGGDYWRQLVFYKILCDNSLQFKKLFPGKKVTTTQLEFLEKSRSTSAFLTCAIKVSPEVIAEVTETIKFVHDQIQQLNFEKIEKSEPCERCPFYNLCWKR